MLKYPASGTVLEYCAENRRAKVWIIKLNNKPPAKKYRNNGTGNNTTGQSKNNISPHPIALRKRNSNRPTRTIYHTCNTIN